MSISGGSLFTALIPLYLTTPSPIGGTYYITPTNVDDVFAYSINGADFVESHGSSISISFPNERIAPPVRLVLWYRNTAWSGAYLNLSFDPNITVWSLMDPREMQGVAPNQLPYLPSVSSGDLYGGGISGLIFLYQSDISSYTDYRQLVPKPSGTFYTNVPNKINFWTDEREGNGTGNTFRRPAGTIEWPNISINIPLGTYIPRAYPVWTSNTNAISPFNIPTQSFWSGSITNVSTSRVTALGSTVPGTQSLSNGLDWIFSIFSPLRYLDSLVFGYDDSGITGVLSVGDIVHLCSDSDGMVRAVFPSSYNVPNVPFNLFNNCFTNHQVILPFSAIPSQIAAFTLSAPASTFGLPVTLTILSGPATISGTPGGYYTITPTGNGIVTLAANQAGNSEIDPAEQVTTTFMVGYTSIHLTVGQQTNILAGFVGSFGQYQAINSSGGDAILGLPAGITYTINNYGTQEPYTLYQGHLVGTPTAVGTYYITIPVVGGNSYYSVIVASGTASISFSSSELNPTYTGLPLPVTCTTAPPNLSVAITYDGSATPPTNVRGQRISGNLHTNYYLVRVTIDDVNWSGEASASMYINPAPVIINFPNSGSLHPYTGNVIAMEYSTIPAGVPVTLVYRDGDNNVVSNPIHSGTYSVTASSDDNNYIGTSQGQLIISGEPYYYNNATGDGNLSTIANWWLDNAHTLPSTSLPSRYDTVYIDRHFGVDASTTSFFYDRVIVGKYSTDTIIPIVWHNDDAGPTIYGIICNFIEFWNGASIDPLFGGGLHTTGVVHYPCSAPLAGLIADGGISYVGYPYAVASMNKELPLQTLWIDLQSHGTAVWSYGVAAASTSTGLVKEGDDFLFQVAFKNRVNFNDPKITEISCTLKDSDQNVVFSTQEFMPCVLTGSLASDSGRISYLMYLRILPDALIDLWATGEITESVTLTGEIKWNEVNFTGVGPSILHQRSHNFPLVIGRSLSNYTPE